MAETILVLFLITILICYLLYISIHGTKLSRKALLLSISTYLIATFILFLNTGTGKIKSDITRLIHNTGPKESGEVYAVLFKESFNHCVSVINFKDQVIPKIDCCIWMELKICPAELNRILSLKKYEKSRLTNTDSMNFIHSFNDKPIWWTPQLLGDSLTKYYIQFNQTNEQTIIFGDDSTHIYLCDQAL